MPKNSVHAIPVTSIDSADFDGSFQLINTGGLPQSCFLLRIVNNSSADAGISYDGLVTHEIVPAGDSVILNAQANNAPNNHVANFAKGTRVYASGDAGDGEVYLIGYYQEKP